MEKNFLLQIQQQMTTNKSTIILWVLVLLFIGCKQRDRFYISKFEHPVKVEIQRFDVDFIALDTSNTLASLKALEQKYPGFYSLFLRDVLLMQLTDSTNNAFQITNFLNDSVFRQVNQKVKDVFNNTKPIEQDLAEAFSYLHHYFPDKPLPDIYFFVSGFNHQFLVADTILGVGTDLYLGVDYPLYPDITYEYLIQNMRYEMLVPDLITTWLHQIFPFQGKDDVLSHMLYEGKILYLKETFLPDTPKNLLIGYEPTAIDWCKTHEKQIWASMLGNKHLFSTRQLLITQLIHPAPFTSPISSDSPGRLGVWIGWQIVKSYMQNNKNVGLSELMNDHNYQQMLEQSHYRP
ncbi:MAG: hypothetical protein BWY08_01191 [Bacteroidetes bacterium ADurb.Bin174]|nr:MAG: hypothetical protein BWY08_01191 [Bacteroidetes bacterium ADurb.Bin174]